MIETGECLKSLARDGLISVNSSAEMSNILEQSEQNSLIQET